MACFHTAHKCCLPLHSKWLNLVPNGSAAVCCWCHSGFCPLQLPVAVEVVEQIAIAVLFGFSFSLDCGSTARFK